MREAAHELRREGARHEKAPARGPVSTLGRERTHERGESLGNRSESVEGVLAEEGEEVGGTRPGPHRDDHRRVDAVQALVLEDEVGAPLVEPRLAPLPP